MVRDDGLITSVLGDRRAPLGELHVLLGVGDGEVASLKGLLL